MLHARFYLRPEDYSGQSILVVGSFASGSDISRQLASLNLYKFDHEGRPLTPDDGHHRYTRVYVSSSGVSPLFTADGPWKAHIIRVPLIDHVDAESIYFADHDPLHGIDTIIFATGYNLSLPFCKKDDEPWAERDVLERIITAEERKGGEGRDVGGIKASTQRDLDELLLFLDGDRSIAFPVLRELCVLDLPRSPTSGSSLQGGTEYGIVPFPFGETQTRLTSLLWAGLLPSFPDHPTPPPHLSNPYITQPITPLSTPSSSPKPISKSVSMREKLFFGAPYHHDYEDHLMLLCLEADERAGLETPDHWKAIESWRRERRADIYLRIATLGY